MGMPGIQELLMLLITAAMVSVIFDCEIVFVKVKVKFANLILLCVLFGFLYI